MPQAIEQAVLFHQQGRLIEAERLYRDLLRAQPKDFDALHLLGVLKLQQGNPADALGLISKAVEARPGSLEALSNLSAALAMLNRHDEALALSDRMLTMSANDVAALYNRGTSLTHLGRHQEALASFDKALAIRPDYVNARFNRAMVLTALGRDADALADYDKVPQSAPRYPDALINRGIVLARLERDDEALASFDQALAIRPDQVIALSNRGSTLRKLQRFDEALASFDRALAVAPAEVNVLNNRGNTLIDLYRPLEALATFERALKISPNDLDVLTNCAFALHALGRFQDALRSSEEALASGARSANTYVIRGHILAKLDRPREAALSHEQALAIEPDHPFAFGASVMCHLAACAWDRIPGLVAAVEGHVRAGKAVIPPFNLLGLPVQPSDRLQCARNFVRQRVPAGMAPLPPRSASQSGRIRVGYFSGDFRRHPISYLIPELLERHDRTRFEVLGFSYGPDDNSEERARIAKAVDRFEDGQGRPDRDVAQLIRDLQADIVVDLGGHTENSRSGLLAWRPAPIQVNYLGYAGTTGADFIDYIVADAIVLPVDQQPHYSEKIVQLPDCFLVNDTTKAISAQAPSRAEAGLPERGFVFCCFNNSYKITAEIFDLWMRLLEAVDGSVLWLSPMNDGAIGRMRERARAGGVDPVRIVFAQRVPQMADHLARHRQADLFVDTPRFNAHTTASDALWAGLPVLTCSGDAFAGRVAASMLHAVGLPELVTASLDDYEALARKLAREPELLASIRRKLEHNRSSQPLFDTDRFRRHLEAAFATMWETWQRGEGPRSFAVDPIEG